MNLKAMESLLETIVQDKSLSPRFKDMINDAIAELAIDFDFPTLKKLDPATLEVAGSSWIWTMPSDFHKKLFRCAFRDTDGEQKSITVFDRREDLEFRDHTIVGTRVNSVAVAPFLGENKLLIDPLPPGPVQLLLWYYQRPEVLRKPTDVCVCIPEEFHDRVIIPEVLIKNFELIQDQIINFDMRSIQYWQAKKVVGLYGSPGDSKGLIRHFESVKGPPRRRGGRDPVGWRAFRYGR